MILDIESFSFESTKPPCFINNREQPLVASLIKSSFLENLLSTMTATMGEHMPRTRRLREGAARVRPFLMQSCPLSLFLKYPLGSDLTVAAPEGA